MWRRCDLSSWKRRKMFSDYKTRLSSARVVCDHRRQRSHLNLIVWKIIKKKTNAKIFSLDTRSTLTFWCRRQIIDEGRPNLKLKRKQHFSCRVYYCWQQMWSLLWHGCVAIARTHEKHIFDEFLSLKIFNTQIPSAEKKKCRYSSRKCHSQFHYKFLNDLAMWSKHLMLANRVEKKKRSSFLTNFFPLSTCVFVMFLGDPWKMPELPHWSGF